MTWDQVVEYTFLAEFDLLRFSQVDIREKQWAQPGVREATTRYFKLKCVQDEIVRLNVEIRRLASAIEVEGQATPEHIQHIRQTQPALASVIQRHWELRHAVNVALLGHLWDIACLPGFSGTLRVGQHLGAVRAHSPPCENATNLGSELDILRDTAEDPDPELSEDDEVVEVMQQFEAWNASLD